MGQPSACGLSLRQRSDNREHEDGARDLAALRRDGQVQLLSLTNVVSLRRLG
jgi:hypothetical protein